MLETNAISESPKMPLNPATQHKKAQPKMRQNSRIDLPLTTALLKSAITGLVKRSGRRHEHHQAAFLLTTLKDELMK
jgi:hypothetical protein